MKDYYSLLRIKPDASPAHVDAAYRRLMQRYHPNARATPQSLDRLRDLNQAWRVLSDPVQRAAYDAARANGSKYEPPAAAPSPRAMPQSAQAEFGARRSTGGTCLVAVGVALVLVFALGVLGWGLNQQIDFGELFKSWQREAGEVLPIIPHPDDSVALDAPTPTPDPRCRDGCMTPPPGCVVKGDVEPGGAQFFYLPNDEGYATVRVDAARGDRWFCALNDAQSAGWIRKAPTATPTLPPPPEALTTGVARRAYVVCAENASLRQGPTDEYALVQAPALGTRLTVTGVVGDWSVVNLADGAAYIRTAVLCAPTPSARAQTVATSAGSAVAATPLAASQLAAFAYAAPQLVSPTHGSKYWCNRDLILTWSQSAPLGPNDYFLVESKAHERERWTALADWTKDTSVTLHPNRGGGSCDAFWWGNTGVFQWRVSVVSGSKEKPTYLSPFSEPFTINYSQ